MKSTQKRRVNFLFPSEIAEELYRLVPPRRRGRVVSEAVARELQRLRARAAIEQSAGAWSETAHPELATGVQIDRWIARGRRELGWDAPRRRRR